eukprot:3794711-Prymnesium_polylepis.3
MERLCARQCARLGGRSGACRKSSAAWPFLQRKARWPSSTHAPPESRAASARSTHRSTVGKKPSQSSQRSFAWSDGRERAATPPGAVPRSGVRASRWRMWPSTRTRRRSA